MATPSSFTFPQRYVWLKSAPLTCPAWEDLLFLKILLIFVEISESGRIFCSFSWSLSSVKVSCGCWKSPGQVIFPEAANPSKVLLVSPEDSLKNWDGCVPGNRYLCRTAMLMAPRTSFPGRGPPLSGDRPWRKWHNLGFTLVVSGSKALTLSSGNRDGSDKGVS